MNKPQSYINTIYKERLQLNIIRIWCISVCNTTRRKNCSSYPRVFDWGYEEQNLKVWLSLFLYYY